MPELQITTNDRPDGLLHSGPARDRAQSGTEPQPRVRQRDVSLLQVTTSLD